MITQRYLSRSISSRVMLHKLFWVALPLSIVLGLFLVLIHMLNLLGYEGQFVNQLRPNPVTAIVSGTHLGQTFVAPRSDLQRIDVLMYGPLWHNSQPVTFHLVKIGDDRDLLRVTFDASEIRGWRWKSFQFSPLSESAGQSYYFFFESSTSELDDALTLGGVQGDLYPNGTALIDEHPVFGDLAFKTFYAGMSLQDKLLMLRARIREHKPSVWGNARFYLMLGALYLLLVIRLGWRLYQLPSSDEKELPFSSKDHILPS